MLNLYSLSLLGGFCVALLLTPLCRRLAIRLDVVDRPAVRKHQTEAVPMLGGVAIAVAHLAVVSGGFLLLHFSEDALRARDLIRSELSFQMGSFADLLPLLVMLLGGLVILVLGIMDDRQGLGIKTRVAVETVVAVAVVLSGVSLSIPFLPSPGPEILTVAWIVGLTNSINLIDGLDGLCAGVSIIAAFTLGAVMIWGLQPLVAALLLALGGATAGFLLFNFPSARIYMGSAGSIYLGYSLACATALATFTMNTNVLASLALPVMVFAVPLYDTFSVIAIRTKEGVSIGRADRNHLHHRLLRLGFSRKQATLFIWLLTFCTAVPAMQLVNSGYLDSIIVILTALSVVGLIVLIERVQGHFVTQRPAGDD